MFFGQKERKKGGEAKVEKTESSLKLAFETNFKLEENLESFDKFMLERSYVQVKYLISGQN